MTDSHILLCRSHETAAHRRGLALLNYGWVVDDDAICSKTQRGYLTTKRRGPRKYTHEFEAYEKAVGQ